MQPPQALGRPTSPVGAPDLVQGWSEFGIALGELVQACPGGIAAILCDDEGETIDMAYDAKVLSALDVELHSAQIAQVAFRMTRAIGHLNLTNCVTHVRASQRQLIFGVVAHEYLVTLALLPRANLARSRTAFSEHAHKIAGLLR